MPRSRELADFLLQVFDRDRVHAAEGLVEQDQPGLVTSARAISSFRRSPPEQVLAGWSALCERLELDQEIAGPVSLRSLRVIGSVSRIASRLSSHERRPKTLGSCER
jgi:hypothetical protein